MARYVKSGTVNTVQEINSELEKIATAQTEFLSRRGETPNEMLNTLDMNNNRITNLPAPVSATDALRRVDLTGEYDVTVGIDETPVFDNIAEMTSTNLTVGQLVRCKRYYSGGELVSGLLFEIVASATGTADGGSFHNLSNGNQAKLFFGLTSDVRHFGAVGDGVTDDTSAFEAAVLASNSIHVASTDNSYILSRAITLPDGFKISGNGYKSYVVQTTLNTDNFIMGDDCIVTNLRLKTADSNDDGFPSAVYANRVNNPVIDRNWIEVGQNGACGVHSRNCRQSAITGNIIYGGTWDGLGNAQAPSACDIMFYSANAEPSERHIISGNFCLSNNSQGIGIDLLGYDSDLIVANNICITLDPATCTSGGTWGLIDSVSLIRRHGIMIAYNDSLSSGTRCVVEGNICRNTGWTGIRKLGNNSEPIIIANNFCSFNGLDNNIALTAGIYIGDQSGVEIVSNNYITNFLNPQLESGAIVITKSTNTTNTNFTKVTSNTIKNCTKGVSLGLVAYKVSVKNNSISTSGNCVYYNGSPNTESGGHVIESNEFQVTSLNPAITVRAQSSVYPTFVTKNNITGFDNTTNDVSNVGIRLADASPLLIITDNYVTNCFHGVYGAAFYNGGRMFDYVLANNIFKDCERGFSVGSSSSANVLPLVDNIFIGVTTEVSNALAGFPVGVACQKIRDNIEYSATSIPTTGTWIAGDRAYNSASVVGQPKAWRYDSVGVWVNEGNL